LAELPQPAIIRTHPMNYDTFRIIHVIGVATVAMGLGGMLAGSANRKAFVMLQGIGLFIMLFSGFGLLGVLHLGFPHFAMVKVALWLVVGVLPVILRRSGSPMIVGILVSLALIGVLAWLGITKPALW
jgi:hypothetical protein